MKKLKMMDVVENSAVAVCVAASTMIAFFAKDANFVVVFSLFTVSALTLAVTTYIKQQFSIMRLQMFFVIINLIALSKQVM